MADQPHPFVAESADLVADPYPTAVPAFAPVEVNPRIDGWTPERQRDFVEALADTGVVRDAAARVGMSEQSFARLRRRPGSAPFVAACEAAITIATRRLRSVAFDRAINGYTRQIFYHGELKGEERVYDPRLLILLLQKSGLLADPCARGAKLEANWSDTIAAIGDGAAATAASDEDDDMVWEENGRLWTRFPPPAGYRGTQHGSFGDDDYERTLTKAEIAALEPREARRDEAERRDAERCRDAYFGFTDPSGG